MVRNAQWQLAAQLDDMSDKRVASCRFAYVHGPNVGYFWTKA